MHDNIETTSNQPYYHRSHEIRLLNCLIELDTFLLSHKISYCLFGGLAVASYAGHLIRKLHDIDIILKPNQIESLQNFIINKGFAICETNKSKKAQYLKYVRHDKNGVYQLKTSIFPGKFILLNLDSSHLSVLATYDFQDALSQSQRRVISSLDGEREARVNILPIEDLIISKLWPTLEPTTIHDLLILLTSPEAKTFNMNYIFQKINSSQPLREIYCNSMAIFKKTYKNTAWYKLATNISEIDQMIGKLDTLK